MLPLLSSCSLQGKLAQENCSPCTEVKGRIQGLNARGFVHIVLESRASVTCLLPCIPYAAAVVWRMYTDCVAFMG